MCGTATTKNGELIKLTILKISVINMLNSRITKKDGKLWFDIDGELLPPYAYMTYCPNKKYIEEFKNAGYKLFSFPVYMSDWGINTETGLKAFCQHIYVNEGEYDFTVVDKYLEMFAPNGKGAYVFPRVFLQTPSFWDREHPHDLGMDFAGDVIRNDFASQRVREDLWTALKALIDHIENSIWKDCVIGYQIAGGGTEEWPHQIKFDEQYIGYSQSHICDFKNWLTKKYKDINKLNSAWNKTYQSFDDVSMPSPGELSYAFGGMVRDSKKEMHVIDYYTHLSELVADTILYYANKVKKYSHGKAITGTFYGYIWMFHKAYKGHNALNKLLNSPDIDFIASTNGWPGSGLSWPFGSAPHSALLHNKIFMCEGDIRTHLTDSLEKTMPHAVPDGNDYYTSDVWRAVKDEFQSASVVKKAIARALTGNVGLWWFDMFSGWFSSPKLMDLISLVPKLSNEGSKSLLKPEIALILDEESVYYTVKEVGAKGYFGNRTPVYNRFVCDEQKTQLGRMGAPYDIYEAKDLANPDFDPDKYKLYIFVDMVNPSPQVRDAIEKRIKSGGRTLLWCYLTDVENNSKITDFETAYNKGDEPMASSFMGRAFPSESVSCPRFTDSGKKNAYTVLEFDNCSEPCVMYKENKDFRSFYSLLPAVPAKLLGEICHMAGVHLYSKDEDVIYAGGDKVAIHSEKGGVKHLFFPKALKELIDVETGERMKFYDSQLFFHMEKDDTRIFKVIFK